MKYVIKALLFLLMFSLGVFFGFLGGIKYSGNKLNVAVQHCPAVQKMKVEQIVQFVKCLNDGDVP